MSILLSVKTSEVSKNAQISEGDILKGVAAVEEKIFGQADNDLCESRLKQLAADMNHIMDELSTIGCTEKKSKDVARRLPRII